MKFFNQVDKGIHKFGKGFVKVDKYLDKKVVPTIERANKIIGKDILPIAELGASFIAPEAVPFLEIARQGSNKLGKATKKVKKGIEISKQLQELNL
jgi:hypothetical protein